MKRTFNMHVHSYGCHVNGRYKRRFPMVHITAFPEPSGELQSISFDPDSVLAFADALKRAAGYAKRNRDTDVAVEMTVTEPDDEEPVKA